MPLAAAAAWLRAHSPLVAGLAVAVPALALYARTLMPGVHNWDTAEFQAIGPVLGIAHPTGFPSYTLLAWAASVVLQPFGDEALRANLLSAILAAGASGLAAAAVTLVTRHALAGIAAGAALAASATGWSVGLHADAHALHLFLVALLLVLLVGWAQRTESGAGGERWLLAAAVVFAVALGNHALTLLLAPGVAAFVLFTTPRIIWRRAGLVVACALALGITTVALYAYLPIRSAMDPPLDYANPETLDGFRYLVFAEQFRGTFRDFPPLPEAITQVLEETVAQLGPFVVLAVAGAVYAALRRPALLLLLVLWFAVTWVFALGYVNADIERYHLGPILAAAVLAGLGAAALMEGLAWLVTRVADRSRPRTAQVVVAGLAAVLLLAPTLAAVPDRYDDVDESDQHMAREWLEAVLPQLEPDAVVLSWWSWSTPLWYAQHVEGRRPDLAIFDDRTVLDQGYGRGQAVIDRFLDERPVYLIRLAHDIPEFEAEYELEPLPDVPHSPVYRVASRRSGEGVGRDP